MAIRFVTDSGSDIVPKEAKALGIFVVPMTITFDGKEYKDCITLSHSKFYEMLIESDSLPTTSQVTPGEFEITFKEIADAGDQAVCITLSSKLSGTYQSACIAAEDFPGKVFVVDSENACIGQRLLVFRAIELQKQGLSAEKIAEQLDREKKSVRLLAALDTLEYLKKGGRISAATAFAGSLLSIKPVITLRDGAVELVGKARGSKNLNNLLRNLIGEGRGVDFDRPYCVAYSGLSDAVLRKYIEDNEELWQSATQNLPMATVGCVIGTHVGPGAIAVAFFEKE